MPSRLVSRASTSSLLALALAVSGCASPSLADAPPPARRPPACEPAGPAPQGVLVPVDTWRRALARALPAPWTPGPIEAQVEAPPGWARLRGDRGLVLWIEDGVRRQPFWVMSRAFEGRLADPSVAARPCADSDDLVLYAARNDVPGWTHTAEVVAALGLRARP